jgi:hypothetical protein
VLGCAKHLSPLLLHAAEATLIHLNVVERGFSEDEMRRPTLNAVPYGLQTLYGLLRPGRRIGPQ